MPEPLRRGRLGQLGAATEGRLIGRQQTMAVIDGHHSGRVQIEVDADLLTAAGGKAASLELPSDCAVVRVRGPLDAENAPLLEAELGELIAARPVNDVVLDLTLVTVVGKDSRDAIANAARTLHDLGAELHLVS